MNYSLQKNKKAIMTGGAETMAISEERENRRLRAILQKAVEKEKAPANLHERIRRMIRE